MATVKIKSFQIETVQSTQITGTLAIANGGTGATDATTARQNLDLEIGVDVQAYNANLTAWASKTAPTGDAVGTTDSQTLTNKTISGIDNLISDINLASQVTGTLPVANGGTGASSSTGTNKLVLSDSPQFEGTPSAPTALIGTNTTQIATTAFVTAAVDSARAGLDVKQSVKAATTANITLSNTQTIDGVALSVGDRVLVKNQSTASQNGIYVVSATAWTRATDADTNDKVTPGMFVFVEQGTTNSDSGWVLTTDAAITVGTTALAFAQFSGAGQITAGDGLTKTGNTVNVVAGTGLTVGADDVALTGQALALHNLASSGLIVRTGAGEVAARTLTGTASRITVTNGDGVSGNPTLDISSSYAGQNTITTLGTITTGTWNGTTLAIANGGTGATDAETARQNLGLELGVNVQAYDGDLKAIADLTGTSGILKKTGADTWVLDSTAYISDTRPTIEEIIPTAGQTVITTSVNTAAKANNKSSIVVFLNGVLQREGTDRSYTVTGINEITFTFELSIEDEVIIYSYI